MRVIHTTPRKINIVGIDDHELAGLNVVTAAALLDTQKGPIIGVFHEYAHLGKGKSIHASGQMEWFNCQVDDRSKIVGGAQRIETTEGYVVALSIESGLVYMHTIRIPTDQDLQQYPHIFFTSPDIWDPSVLDHGITPSLLEDITNILMIHCSKTPSLMNMEISITELSKPCTFSVTYLLYLLGSPSHMLTCMTPILLKKIGHPSDPILVGNQNKSSKTLTRSHPDLEAPSQDMITSRSISSPGILFSISLDEMSLLPLILYSVAPQPSMMVVPLPNSLLAKIPWYVMPTASKVKSNSSTPFITISDPGEL